MHKVYTDQFQPTLPARGATGARWRSTMAVVISTHAPRTGSDANRRKSSLSVCVFQPTLPARGATSRIPRIVLQSRYFNPRSPHGERHQTARNMPASDVHFNPRSPHGERQNTPIVFNRIFHFNPRSPHGERRACRLATLVVCDFNPRSPHGERR